MSGDQPNDRRAFLRGLVRWPALAAREGRPLQAGERCVNRGVCRGCGALATCGRPQARLARVQQQPRPGEPRF